MNRVLLAHRTKLYPTKAQEVYFRKACGISRFAYNWALASWKAKYATGEKGMSGYSLQKEWNAVRHQEFPWTGDVTKWAGQKAIENLGEAYQRFFKKKARRPRFKKKGRSRDSFYLGVSDFLLLDNRIRVPKLGYVKMAQKLRFPGKPKSVTISSEAGEWFVSVLVEIDLAWLYKHKCANQEGIVGIDLGLKDLATTFDGSVVVKVDNEKSYRKAEKKTKRLHRALSRKKKGSTRGQRAKRVLSKHLRKQARRRKDTLHKLTSSLVRRHGWICVEDLNVAGMAKTKLSKSVYDSALGEVIRQLQYKARLAGSVLVQADRWFPSSKLCSHCGHKRVKLSLSEREWACETCGTTHDRDGNAARNLYELARRHRDNQTACGEDVGPQSDFVAMWRSSMKQESLFTS